MDEEIRPIDKKLERLKEIGIGCGIGCECAYFKALKISDAELEKAEKEYFESNQTTISIRQCKK